MTAAAVLTQSSVIATTTTTTHLHSHPARALRAGHAESRVPLYGLSMSASQRPRRRSARHAQFDEDDGDVAPPPAKRTRVEQQTAVTTNGTTTSTNTTGKAGAAKTNGAKKGKARSAAYDEDDDGFTFSRTRSKRTRSAAAAPSTQTIPEEPAKASEPARATSRRKKKDSLAPLPPPATSSEAESTGVKRRRSARLSSDHSKKQLPVTPPPVERPKAKRTKKTAEKPAPAKAPANEPDDEMDLVGGETAQPKTPVAVPAEEKRVETTKIIQLPFADTPVISRNKEMRKGAGSGHRRSSTGLRGRRASSLIDSGSNAIPHMEVETTEFYKLIEQSLPEPRRMKQLLTWCASRALPPKPTGNVKDHGAIMSAREIQKELLDDFATKSEMSDWFGRTDDDSATVVKKPNPRNEQNEAKLKELEEEVQRLKDEKEAWRALLKSSSKLSLEDTPVPAPTTTIVAEKPTAPPSPPKPSNPNERYPKSRTNPLPAELLPAAAPPPPPPNSTVPPPSTSSILGVDLNLSLLDPSQVSLLHSLYPSIPSSTSPSTTNPSTSEPQPSSSTTTTAPTTTQPPQAQRTTLSPPLSPTTLRTRLHTLTHTLEPTIDRLADGVHRVGQYRATADRVADRLLAHAADSLEERDRAAKRKAGTAGLGTRDVLSALAGVLSGTGSGNGVGGDGR